MFPVEFGARVSNDTVLGPVIGPIQDALVPGELGVEVTIGTPLPDGNLVLFEDRWRLIEEDTLPAFETLVTDHPDQAADILSTPVEHRYGDHRAVHRIDDLITSWELEFKPFARSDGSVWSAIGDFLFGGGDGGPQGPVEVPTGTTSTTIAEPTSEPATSTSTASTPPGPSEGPPTGTTVPTTIPPDDAADG